MFKNVVSTSRVAPYLRDLYLAACGKNIQENLKGQRIEAIFAYVDDFLILCNTDADEPINRCLNAVPRTSKRSCPGLSFTHELPVNRTARFQNLSSEFKTKPTCAGRMKPVPVKDSFRVTQNTQKL